MTYRRLFSLTCLLACTRPAPAPSTTPTATDTVGDLLPSSGHARLLLVLDGKSLAVRRRIKDVVVDCDQGMDLNGTIVLSPTPVLEQHLCSGHARVDLLSGRYLCRPIEDTAQAGPRCPERPHYERQALSAHYSYDFDKSALLRGEAVVLEGNSPSVSPDETRAALIRDNHLVIVALPSGHPLDAP